MKTSTPNETSATVVVVNDDATQLHLLSGLLTRAGIVALPFTGAEAALEAMEQNNLPDLIITDLYMPGLDGWRFCRLLRSPEYKNFNRIPILVVSATYTGDEAERITADAGANAILCAPVDGEQFIRHVRDLIRGEQPWNPLRVLIVEDSTSLASILKKVFEANGYGAETALTSHAAADAFGKSVWDVAVIDYHLPDGQGDVLLRDFQTQQPECVCIMMTTDPTPGLALEWMKQGAAAYLRKPFQPEYLIELCEKARRERALLRVQDLLELRTQEFRASEEKHRLAMEATTDGLWDWNVKTGGVYFSPGYYHMLGYLEDDFPGKAASWMDLIHPDDRANAMKANAECIEGRSENFAVEFRMKAKNGEWRWVLGRGKSITRDAEAHALRLVGTHVDITERKLAQDEIKNLLREKELLLKEVHHRIKNNMNTMMSLLSLQADALKNSSAAVALRDAGNRMRSMHVLYDKLYRSEDFGAISMKLYLPHLIDQIMDTFSNREMIKMETQVDDFILQAKKLSPLGILINELLANIMKYAFIGRESGMITVSASLNVNHATIIVQDDGVGLPASVDIASSTGFGLQLVDMLTKQLGGHIKIERGNGTKFVLEFDVG